MTNLDDIREIGGPMPKLTVRQLVDKQAEDEGLWFVAETASEAYLQQELRRLHALIESGGTADSTQEDR